jgi:hypothetical protein
MVAPPNWCLPRVRESSVGMNRLVLSTTPHYPWKLSSDTMKRETDCQFCFKPLTLVHDEPKTTRFRRLTEIRFPCPHCFEENLAYWPEAIPCYVKRK